MKNIKIKNYEIDNIQIKDYPKFCDAFLSYAEDENGKELTDCELEKWQDDNPEKFNQMVLEAVTGGNYNDDIRISYGKYHIK